MGKGGSGVRERGIVKGCDGLKGFKSEMVCEDEEEGGDERKGDEGDGSVCGVWKGD